MDTKQSSIKSISMNDDDGDDDDDLVFYIPFNSINSYRRW